MNDKTEHLPEAAEQESVENITGYPDEGEGTCSSLDWHWRLCTCGVCCLD